MEHPEDGRRGQTWEEGGWPGRTNGSRLWLIAGESFELNTECYVLIDLETGERDAVRKGAIDRVDHEGWERVA